MTQILLGLIVFLGLGAFAQDAPIATMEVSGAGTATAIGIKLYYGDDTVLRIEAKDFATGWLQAKSDGVQVLRVYYDRSYRIWDSAQEKPVLRNYAETIQGHDFYYWSPTRGFGNTDLVKDVPADVVAVKIGTMLPDGEFLRIYNKSHNDHIF